MRRRNPPAPPRGGLGMRVFGLLSTGMLAWRLNAGFDTSGYRLLQPQLSCRIERVPGRSRNRRGEWIWSHAYEGSESKHVECLEFGDRVVVVIDMESGQRFIIRCEAAIPLPALVHVLS